MQRQDENTVEAGDETPGPASVEARIDSIATEVADALDQRSVSLAVAESCTAGQLAEALARAGHASRWLRAGLVAYQDDVKRDLLGVTAPSVVTPEAAAEMATGAARLFGTEVTAATTGVFGDEPVDGVEPTTVVIATFANDDVRVTEHRLDDDPSAASDQAVEAALSQILAHVRDQIPRPRHDSHEMPSNAVGTPGPFRSGDDSVPMQEA